MYRADTSELLQFLSSVREIGERKQIQKSDFGFACVLEDVLNLLVDKRVLSFTDLPEAVRYEIVQSQSLRRRYNNVDLIGDDDMFV